MATKATTKKKTTSAKKPVAKKTTTVKATTKKAQGKGLLYEKYPEEHQATGKYKFFYWNFKGIKINIYSNFRRFKCRKIHNI